MLIRFQFHRSSFRSPRRTVEPLCSTGGSASTCAYPGRGVGAVGCPGADPGVHLDRAGLADAHFDVAGSGLDVEVHRAADRQRPRKRAFGSLALRVDDQAGARRQGAREQRSSGFELSCRLGRKVRAGKLLRQGSDCGTGDRRPKTGDRRLSLRAVFDQDQQRGVRRAGQRGRDVVLDRQRRDGHRGERHRIAQVARLQHRHFVDLNARACYPVLAEAVAVDDDGGGRERRSPRAAGTSGGCCARPRRRGRG